MKYLVDEFLLFWRWLPVEVQCFLIGIVIYFVAGWQYVVTYGIGFITAVVMSRLKVPYKMWIPIGLFIGLSVGYILHVLNWL